MRKTTLIAFLLIPLALAVRAGASGDATPQLIGTVGTNDAFVISLADPNGQRVTKLDPGTYTLLVHDNSAIHNFHLLGPGVDVATDVELKGDQTFTITVQNGDYSYFCDPHALSMRGSFTVGTAPPPPSPPPPPPASVGKLSAAVSATGKVTVSAKSVSAGSYRITVRDRSHAGNFHVVGKRLNRKTTKAFVGTVTWTVKLAAGKYRYGSDPKLNGSLRVSSGRSENFGADSTAKTEQA